jgi:excisionase family DNA binding protein
MMLTIRQVAERLNISASTVYSLVSSRKLPCHRIGVGRGAVRVSEEDLSVYLESCRQPVIEPRLPVQRVKLKHLRLP